MLAQFSDSFAGLVDPESGAMWWISVALGMQVTTLLYTAFWVWRSGTV